MMRAARIVALFSSLFLCAVSFYSYSERHDISQEYSSANGNVFLNTTSQSGFCVNHSQFCIDNNLFSVRLSMWVSLMHELILANATPQDGVYIKLPGLGRDVRVTNAEGKVTTVHFRVAGFAASYGTHNDWTTVQHNDAWVGGSFAYAPSPCISSGFSSSLPKDYTFMWKWPLSDAACYKLPVVDLKDEPYVLSNISILYELKNASPQLLTSGDYTGTLHFNVGRGGDLDFGNVFEANDSSLDFNFRLTVKHDFSITTTADDKQVALQPCKPNQVCTAQEGEENWERWMVSRVTPQLTGRSNFGITSTGNFTVYLACATGQIGQDCALQSDNSSLQVPVSASLNLPSNIVDNATGAAVVKRHLNVGKDAAQNIFTTKSYAPNQKGSIDFFVTQRDVDTMLSTRPDTYRGGVTVIFDQDIN
ncbi:hypothetical protein [Kosakonia sacchari]|uniref:Fimbrial protein n=1 Tax=Kosakonia sacchari TaxID=1158459 RepID=A0A1G4YZZ4_9ENTR|nr:hypothetical protein [Kosakonia sacchari]SCX58875.1 hypothetical protein SAMN02927897_03702 [Kosakonia sacchari]